MLSNSHHKWGVRLGTFGVWALAAASVAYWGLRGMAPPAGLAVPAAATLPAAPDAQALARLLGVSAPGPAAAPAQASRLALVGVLAGRHSGGGAALIAVGGQPAKPFRVGATVEAGLVLQALGPRQARLGASVDGATTLTLDMPVKN
ncbi:MAG: type II secretion system protein N [Burkholderiaceae bacterium]|nr:type II secretion system protein N [Burkholderiaceae bacterium]